MPEFPKSSQPLSSIHRDGPDFLGSDEFARRDPILKAKEDANDALSHKDNSENNTGRVRVDLIKTWERILDEAENINVATLRKGDVIEVYFKTSEEAYRFQVISEFEPNIIRPSNFSGRSQIRLQMVDQEDGRRLDCKYGDAINPGEELFLLGSSFGGSSVHVNILDTGTCIAFQKADRTEVHTLPFHKLGVLRSSANGSLQPVDQLELMGLTPSAEQRPYSQEYGEIYDVFETLASICPIPERDDRGDRLGIWKYDDPSNNRTIEYTVYQFDASNEQKPHQVVKIMDQTGRTMYEIHSEEHTLGAGKRSFQVRAFTDIRDVDKLDEYENCTDEIGINYSNDPALDRTQYYYSRSHGTDGNYSATVNAHGDLEQGRMYSWLPYVEGKNAVINSDGFVEVSKPGEGGEVVSTELVNHELIMQLLSESINVLRQPKLSQPPITPSFEQGLDQTKGSHFIKRIKAGLRRIFFND